MELQCHLKETSSTISQILSVIIAESEVTPSLRECVIVTSGQWLEWRASRNALN